MTSSSIPCPGGVGGALRHGAQPHPRRASSMGGGSPMRLRRTPSAGSLAAFLALLVLGAVTGSGNWFVWRSCSSSSWAFSISRRSTTSLLSRPLAMPSASLSHPALPAHPACSHSVTVAAAGRLLPPALNPLRFVSLAADLITHKQGAAPTCSETRRRLKKVQMRGGAEGRTRGVLSVR